MTRLGTTSRPGAAEVGANTAATRSTIATTGTMISMTSQVAFHFDQLHLEPQPKNANEVAQCPFSDELGAVEQNLSAEEYQLRQQHQSGGGGNGRPRTLSISPSLQLHQQQFLDHHLHTQASTYRVDDNFISVTMVTCCGCMVFQSPLTRSILYIGELQVKEGEQGTRHRP